MTPAPRFALILALVAVSCLLIPWQIALLAAVGLFGLLIADLLTLRGKRKIERELPNALARGVPSPLSITIDQAADRSTIRQPAAPDIAIAEQQDHGQLKTTVTATRRGLHTLPPVVLRTEGKLRLARRFQKDKQSAQITVYPDVPAARRLAQAVRSGIQRGEGAPTTSLLGLGTEFDSIRSYQPDDDIRQVNWRATARVGEPMSNQFRLEQERDLICLIDTGRVMTAPLGDRTQLDTALDATIAVGLVADQVGDRCGAVAFDTEIGKFIKPLRYGGEYLIKALYDIEPRSLESDYTAAFQLVESLKRSLVIVFTDLFEPSAARPLIAALPVLAAKHAVVVASATDPELELDLHRQPRELIDAYRQAATLDVVEVREKVIKAARQAGALVVTASPKNLGAACIDAYLREKRRARI